MTNARQTFPPSLTRTLPTTPLAALVAMLNPVRARGTPADPKLLARTEPNREETRKVVFSPLLAGDHARTAKTVGKGDPLRRSFDPKPSHGRRVMKVGADAHPGRMLVKREDARGGACKKVGENGGEAGEGGDAGDYPYP